MTLIPDEKCLQCPYNVFNKLHTLINDNALQIPNDTLLQIQEHSKNLINGGDETDEQYHEIATAFLEYIILRNIKTLTIWKVKEPKCI